MRPLQLFSFFAVVWLAVAVARAAGGYADGGHVGCTLEQRKGADFLWVDHVAEGGPAADAGIQKGDCIIGLNGISTEKMSAWDGRSRLSGAIGTTLLVRVRRDGSPDTDFTVVRKSLFDACSKAAEAGDPEAQCSIGYWYAYNSTARDPAKAAGFFRKAADQGYGPAQAQLGYMMKYGVGIPKDMKGGVAWYLKASRQGSAYAERDLGLSYLTGEGVPKSDKDAFAWFYSAALQDDSTAERNLGYLYRTGRGVARDDKAAFAWYYRSAQHNDYYGEWGLAYMYQRGYGVKKDPAEAMRLYRKAEVGLPKNESLKKSIALADLQAFIQSPNSKTLNIAALRSVFFWPLVIGLYLLAAVYVAIGVILLCYSLRKPYPPGILVALGWIVFYFESQGVATLSVMITGNLLLADVLIGAIALFGAVPVIISTLGASRSHIWKSSPLPWRTLLAYASALCLALVALGFIHEKVSSLIAHSPLPPQSTMALFEKSKEASAWVTFASLVLVIPIAEEVLFRSYLFDALRRYLSGTATIFLTAFLFAFAHFQVPYFMPLFIMGLVLGLCRLKTGSIRPSIFLHVLNNALAVAAFH